MNAQLLTTDDKILDIEPNDVKRGFTLQECYELLKCEIIEVVNLSDGRILIIDEEGKCKPNEINSLATIHYQRGRITNDMIVGDAIICPNSYLK